MRYVLLLFTLLAFVGCETEAPSSAGVISKERAIAIAIDACKNPEFSQVTRSTWRTDPTAAGGGYWAVDLKDEDESSVSSISLTAEAKSSAKATSRTTGTSKIADRANGRMGDSANGRMGVNGRETR